MFSRSWVNPVATSAPRSRCLSIVLRIRSAMLASQEQSIKWMGFFLSPIWFHSAVKSKWTIIDWLDATSSYQTKHSYLTQMLLYRLILVATNRRRYAGDVFACASRYVLIWFILTGIFLLPLAQKRTKSCSYDDVVRSFHTALTVALLLKAIGVVW